MLLGVTAVNFASAFFQASSGFGYALIAMAIMPQFLAMRDCSAISAVTVVVIGLQMSLTLRKHLKLRIVLLPILCCMLTINVGLYILMHFDEFTLRLILAGLLFLVTGIFFYCRKRQIVIPNRWYSAAIAGLVTGLSTGMFNIVGPFLLIYYMNVCEDTLTMKASLEFSFLLAGMYSMIMHISYGNIRLELLPALTCSAVAAIVAGIIGLRVYQKINKDKIALMAYILLPIMAVSLIVNG